jgi:GNAT superfamily N-acetyltransferase
VITVREVENDADIATYLDVRNRIHPATPMPLEAVLDQRKQPGNLDLIAEVDGVPVGTATTSEFGGAPGGDIAYLSLRVLPEYRRRGVGSALHVRTSEHARSTGKERFYCVVRADDESSLGYFPRYGYAEVGRMQDVVLRLAVIEVPEPTGLRLEPLTEEWERGAYEVALEADADVPSGEPIRSGTFEEWRARHLGDLALRDLSFVAVEDDRVIGYAILQVHGAGSATHSMTGVARAARGRGVALGLKQMQIARAKTSGLKELQTQNDLGNAPMRRVNEKLGYVLRHEWVHMTGPLR